MVFRCLEQHGCITPALLHASGNCEAYHFSRDTPINCRGKIQSLTVSHRLPLVQDCFPFICKWKSFLVFALSVPFHRSLHCLDCVGGLSGALSRTSWKFGAAVIVIAISSLQRDRGTAALFQRQGLGGIYGDSSRLLAL